MSGLKVGDIDVVDQVVDNEFRIKFLTKFIEWLLTHNTSLARPSQDDVTQMRDAAIEEIKSKYPNSGIQFNEEKK